MKTRVLAALAVAGFTLPAFAQTTAAVDANGDGIVTYDEVRVVYPNFTEDRFGLLDSDASGDLNEDEFNSAMETNGFDDDTPEQSADSDI